MAEAGGTAKSSSKILLAVLVALVVVFAGTTAYFALRPTGTGGGTVTYVIGVEIAVSGPYAADGPLRRDGAFLAIDQMNAQLQAAGSNIRFERIHVDSAGTASGAIAQFEALVAAGVQVVVGPLSSAEVGAIAPLADTNRVVSISPSATAPRLALDDFVFRVAPNDAFQARAVTTLLDELGVSNVAIMARDDDYGRGIANLTENIVETEYGGAVERVMYSTSTPDYSADIGVLSDRVDTFGTGADTAVLLVRRRDARDAVDPPCRRVRRRRDPLRPPGGRADVRRGQRPQDLRPVRGLCRGRLPDLARDPRRDDVRVHGDRHLALRDGHDRLGLGAAGRGEGDPAVEPILRLDGVRKHFGGIRAVDELSAQVQEGELVGLIGPNGSGKTTLFHVITGVHKPDAGAIEFRGERIDGLEPHEIFARGVVRCFQNPRLFGGMTVMENVLVPPRDQIGESPIHAPFPGRWEDQELRLAATALQTLAAQQLAGVKGNWSTEISGGQMKLLEVSRALMGEPRLLLLDEPTAGGAPKLAGEIFEGIVRV